MQANFIHENEIPIEYDEYDPNTDTLFIENSNMNINSTNEILDTNCLSPTNKNNNN